MRAIIWTNYGPPEVLQLREVAKPVPKEDQVLIKIYATTVTAGDCELRSLKFPPYLSLPMRIYVGLTKPTRVTILGQELAGQVESVGKAVTLFKSGDQVFGSPGFGLGTYAEYKCLSEKPGLGFLALMPSNVTYAQAAALTVGGLEAVHFLSRADIRKGQTVLINGAGGSIGTFAIQLAQDYGAQVTAVDSTEKLDMLRSLGADRAIDYTQTDFTKTGETYDVIFDVKGSSSVSAGVQALKPNGLYILGNPGFSDMFRGSRTLRDGKRVLARSSSGKDDDILLLTRLVRAGKLKPVIDRSYPLEQVADAHRYVEAGHKKGNLVITVDNANQT